MTDLIEQPYRNVQRALVEPDWTRRPGGPHVTAAQRAGGGGRTGPKYMWEGRWGPVTTAGLDGSGGAKRAKLAHCGWMSSSMPRTQPACTMVVANVAAPTPDAPVQRIWPSPVTHTPERGT